MNVVNRILLRFLLACSAVVAFSPAADAQLRITAPNGGERFFVGGTVNIRWTGVPFGDTVQLEYSIDQGGAWNLITDKATGLQYNWRPVPNLPSDRCLLRVSSRSKATDSILYLPSQFIAGQNELLIYAEFSRDGKKVIGTSGSGHVFIWDAFTKAVLLSMQVEPPEDPQSFSQPMAAARFSPDGEFFAAVGPLKSSVGSFVRIYNATTGALVREWTRVQFQLDQTVTCAYSPDGKTLLATGQRYGLLFDVNTGSQVLLLHGYSDSSGSVTRYGLMYDGEWMPDGKTIAGWDHNRGMVISDAATGDTIRTFRTDRTFQLNYVRLNPDGSRIIASAFDFDTGTMSGKLSPRIKTWDVATGTEDLEFNAFGRFARWGAFSSDGAYIAAVGSEASGQPEELRTFDPITGAFQRVVGKHQGNMFSVHIGPDPSRLLVACNDGARIYQSPTATAGESDVSDAVWSIVRVSGEIVTIALPTIEARQGEFIDAPLTITNPAAALATGATQIDVNLSFNATLLDPIGQTPKGTIENGIRRIALSVPLTSDTLLALLRFRAALGNDSVTILDLDSARADLPGLTVVEDDGEFRLLDLCYAGGARLVNPDGVAALRVLRVDHASGTADAELRIHASSSTLLFLTDNAGRRIRTFLNEPLDPGLYKFSVDLRELPTGGYFLLLQTSAGVQSTRIEVVR